MVFNLRLINQSFDHLNLGNSIQNPLPFFVVFLSLQLWLCWWKSYFSEVFTFFFSRHSRGFADVSPCFPWFFFIFPYFSHGSHGFPLIFSPWFPAGHRRSVASISWAPQPKATPGRCASWRSASKRRSDENEKRPRTKWWVLYAYLYIYIYISWYIIYREYITYIYIYIHRECMYIHTYEMY